jgi:hypothetical protein
VTLILVCAVVAMRFRTALVYVCINFDGFLFFMQEEQFLESAITAFRMEIATMVNEFLLNQGILVPAQL